MNHDELTAIWNSAANTLDDSRSRHAIARMHAEIARRDFAHRAWFIGTLVLLGAATAFAGWVIHAREIEAGSLWIMAPLLILPWIGLLRHRRGASIGEPGAETGAIGNALVTMLAQIRAARRRVGTVLVLQALFVPLLIGTLFQLQAAGKLPAAQAWSLALFLGLALGAGVTSALWRRQRLAREEQKLSRLVDDLKPAASH